MLLTLALSPLKMPLWLGLLIGNLFSSFIMSFVTMPYYVNPLLKKWIPAPTDGSAPRTSRRGIAIVVVALVLWALVFWTVTTQIWHLH